MAGGKETPRQKMIGMMYLVLTALLAMNVSKDILNGFIIVNESLERTNHNLADNTNNVMASFRLAAKSEPRAVPYIPKADEVLKITLEVHDYIDKLKKTVIQETEQRGSYKDSISMDKDLEKGWSLWHADKKDNYDLPTHLLIGDNESAPASGPNTAKELRQKLTDAANKIKALFDNMQKDSKLKLMDGDYKAILKKIESMIPHDPNRMEDGVKETWETENFYHLPLAAVITNLTKIQSDVNNVEAECIQQIAAAPGKTAIKFDKLAAKVIAPSSYIQSGGKYTADIFLAASSSDMGADKLTIFKGASYDSIGKKCTGCDEANAMPIVGGYGKYEAGAGSPGEQKWGGVIRFKNPTGEYEYFPFDQSYMVAPPAAAISLDEMNVIYIGIDNPVTISAAGIAPSELQPSASGGGISLRPAGGPGKYIATATTITPKGQEAVINVSAKTKDGVKPQGSQKFRIRRLPDPIGALDSYENGSSIPKAALRAASKLFAKKPTGFDLNANYSVTKWSLTVLNKDKALSASGNGTVLSAEAQGHLAKAQSGARIAIELTAVAPDKSMRPVSLGFKVN